MRSAESPSLQDRLAGWLSLGVGMVVVIAHVRFLAEDARLPRDMGLYFASLPELYGALGGEAPVSAATDAMLQSGGWYNLVLGLCFKLFGRSPHVVHGLDLLWLMLVLGGTCIIARRLGGPVAGLIAIVLASAFRLFVVDARFSWIHIPELALVLWVVIAWLKDPSLRLRRYTVVIAICGALAMMLRPSGTIWMATILPFLVWRLRDKQSRSHAGFVIVVWAASLVVALAGIAPYLLMKVASRDRYASMLPDVLAQVGSDLGTVPGIIAALGAVACIISQRRLVVGLLVGWITLATALVLITRVGTNNFPVYGSALAILGGWGLSRWPRLGVAGALGALMLAHIPQWVPETSLRADSRRFLRALHIPFDPGPGNYYRPHTAAGGAEVLALIRASCPNVETTCELVVDQGLFHPYGEDPSGRLERFVAGIDHVRVSELKWSLADTRGEKPAALAHFRCGDRDRSWRDRYPDSAAHLQAAIETFDLQPAYEIPWTGHCALVWMTPGGRLPTAARIPGP
jgi:hypothetical protein